MQIPCTLDNSVNIVQAGLLYAAYLADRLTLSVGGRGVTAFGTLQLQGGTYENELWTPDTASEPVSLTVHVGEKYCELQS